jgi:hypothetical protein
MLEHEAALLEMPNAADCQTYRDAWNSVARSEQNNRWAGGTLGSQAFMEVFYGLHDSQLFPPNDAVHLTPEQILQK